MTKAQIACDKARNEFYSNIARDYQNNRRQFENNRADANFAIDKLTNETVILQGEGCKGLIPPQRVSVEYWGAPPKLESESRIYSSLDILLAS